MLTSLLLATYALLQAEAEPAFAETTAFQEAAKENRRVLLIFSSPDAKQAAAQSAVLEPRAVKRQLQYEYVQLDRSEEPAHPNPDLRLAFMILAADGEELAKLSFDTLRKADGTPDPDRFLQVLKDHQTEPWDAMEVLEAARLKAQGEKKNLLVGLGAPW